MKYYILSQQVEVGVDRKEWVDISSSKFKKQIQEFARNVKERNPSAVLALREIQEREVELNEI